MKKGSLANPILLVGMLVVTVVTYWIPDAKAFREPSLARMICWHLPCAFITTGLLFLGAWFGFRYLNTRQADIDIRGAATLELGALFGALTMATGILFSKVQWGAWWQNDPRQTSFLMVLLIFAGGLALRAGLSDEKRRAAASAGYALFALLPNIFLIFVFPRLSQIQQKSFHPSQTIQSGGFDRMYWIGILSVMAMLIWVAVILYQARVRAALLELDLDNQDGPNQTPLDDSATDRVVRPVPLSQERR
ncbi:MAG: cytochrome c biogenesis protein [Fimbriimonadaceae bacterium]|nr:cytochrome c biogenesis protein [Fimbriimonadaceae bacterium]